MFTRDDFFAGSVLVLTTTEAKHPRLVGRVLRLDPNHLIMVLPHITLAVPYMNIITVGGI